MDQQMQTIILVAAGAAVKFLRGYPQFGDWATIGVAVLAALAMTVAAGQNPDVSAFFTHFSTDIQTVLAALGAGHLVAKMSGGKVLPRNNDFAPKQ